MTLNSQQLKAARRMRRDRGVAAVRRDTTEPQNLRHLDLSHEDGFKPVVPSPALGMTLAIIIGFVLGVSITVILTNA